MTAGHLIRTQVSEALQAYRAPWWLAGEFNSPTLNADFGGGLKLEVNFDISLPNGQNLSGMQSAHLRSSIYDFLCIQAHPVVRTGRTRSPEAERRHVIVALHVVDYFLLRADQIGFGRFGFSAVAAPHISQFLATVAQSAKVVESLYDWKGKLGEHLRSGGRAVSNGEMAAICEACGDVEDIDVPESEWELGLTREELVRARAYLFKEGLYRGANDRPYKKAPHTAELSRRIYRNTLYGAGDGASKTVFEELCLSPSERYVREKPGVPVRTTLTDGRCPKLKFEEYRLKLLTWMPLAQLGLGMPEESLRRATTLTLRDFNLKDAGRTSAVPPPVVAQVLRQAICFFYEHGEHLLRSLEAVLNECDTRGCTPGQLHAASSFQALLSPGSPAVGVTCWTLVHSTRPLTTTTFVRTLRSKRSGLLQMCQCLWGAMTLIVGTVLAPRQGEVSDLTPASLDTTGTWIGLMSRKTGFDGERYEDYRPIPQVATDVIVSLKSHLSRLHGPARTKLFAVPSANGDYAHSPNALNGAIDIFLDFIDSPTDKSGARYYLRIHQLRQFFATMFFYSATFSDVETVQWMLRHLDPEHVWAYVSATTKGTVLRQYKADVTALLLRRGSSEVSRLAAMLEEKFGVQRFSVMSEEEIASYVAELMADKRLTVEPVFVVANGVKRVRMGYTVWEPNS